MDKMLEEGRRIIDEELPKIKEQEERAHKFRMLDMEHKLRSLQIALADELSYRLRKPDTDYNAISLLSQAIGDVSSMQEKFEISL